MPSVTEVSQLFEDDENTTVEDEVIDTSEELDTEEDTADTTADESTEDKSVDKDESDDDGYFADEEEEDKTVAPELPAVPASFSAEDKYIIDNLPLINVRVIMADDSIKTMQVRSAAELPRDMKGIATPYEDKQFDLANAAQESRARELQTYYRQHQSQVQAQEFERKENAAIREDIAELQRDGEIPKFKAQPGTRAFNEDPAAKIVDDTIAFMNERNAKYLAKSNAGGTYKHIGFAEAFEIMNGGGKSKIDKQDSSARKDAARKLVSKQGGSSNKGFKAPVAGRTIKDVVAEFDDFEV